MEQILTKRRVRDLAATEANRNLDLVAVLQEAASVLYLGVQVADVDISVRRISLISTTR